MADDRAARIERIMRIEKILAAQGGGPMGPLPSDIKSSQEEPLTADLYGSDRLRAAAGFGDVKGVQKFLSQKGYKNVSQNSKGELVAQHDDGRWYKDANNFFQGGEGLQGYLPKHPLNWLEANAGKSLPVMGMGVGEAIGTAAGAPAGPATAFIGATSGGAAGASLGEGLRQAGGKYMGTMSDVDPDEIMKEGRLGALSVAGGKALSGFPLPVWSASDAARKLLGKSYTSPSWTTAGEAARNVPGAIAGAIKSGAATASSGTTGVQREAVMQLLNRPAEVLGMGGKTAPYTLAQGAQRELKDVGGNALSTMATAKDTFKNNFSQEPLSTVKPVDSTLSFLERYKPNAEGFGEVPQAERRSVSDQATRMFIDPNTGEMTKSAGSLLDSADYLKTQINNFKAGNITAPTSGPYQGHLRSQRRSIKELLHDLDPEGLGAADKQFSTFKSDTSLLKPLENPAQMEGFVQGYHGKTKSAQREAVGKWLPESAQKLSDLGAYRAFDEPTAMTNAMPTSRQALRWGGAAGLMGLGAMQGNPTMAAGGAALGVLTNPQLHRAVLGMGAKAGNLVSEKAGNSAWGQLIQKDPQLAETLLNLGSRYEGKNTNEER